MFHELMKGGTISHFFSITMAGPAHPLEVLREARHSAFWITEFGNCFQGFANFFLKLRRNDEIWKELELDKELDSSKHSFKNRNLFFPVQWNGSSQFLAPFGNVF